MAVWLCRAGRFGEREALTLSESVTVIGWEELPDLSGVATRADLEDLCRTNYPDAKTNTIANWVGQVWSFLRRMEIGDLVVLPLKTQSAIAIGRVTGPYQYRPDFPTDTRHSRPVEWLRKDIPRTAFDQDILFSFGAFMTVCRIQRNNAEERIKSVLSGKPPHPPRPPNGDDDGTEPEIPPNLEQYARDQIQTHIGQKFRGHDLARLVTELLKAQGYRTLTSPAGADGGVDILVGGGHLGFDRPRICVQVKSSDSPVDVGTLRELQGVLRNFGAEQGLLVAWGGFKSSVLASARQLFFEIRLWDAGDLIDALFAYYDRLPADLQAELPLKRIWTLVLEE